MKNLLLSALRNNATSKTFKYFWSNSDAIIINGKSVNGESATCALITTLLALSAAKYTGKVIASNNVYYDAEEYAMPEKFKLLVNARFIGLNEMALLQHRFVDIDHPTLSEGDIVMTPYEMEKYFELYNASQSDSNRLSTSNLQYQNTLLSDVSVVSSEDNWYATNDDYVSNYLGYAANVVVSSALCEYLRPISPVDMSEVERWLLK